MAEKAKKENPLEEMEKKLSDTEKGERIEKYLKNEAYAFILSEGLLNKFLEFRTPLHRSKPQDVFFNLVAEADLRGLWIDF